MENNKGTYEGNSNVKSHHHRGSTAMIDGEGNAYYAERQYCCPRDDEKLFWFWDNNQYDFLVELTTKAIGEIHIHELCLIRGS